MYNIFVVCFYPFTKKYASWVQFEICILLRNPFIEIKKIRII